MTKVSPHLALSLPHLLLTLYPRLGAQPSLKSVLYQHPSWDPFAGPGWDGALPEFSSPEVHPQELRLQRALWGPGLE